MSKQNDWARLGGWDFAGTITRRQVFLGTAIAVGGLTAGSVSAWGVVDDGISHAAAAIHQEPMFKASRKRVYEALTEAAQFHKVSLLSEAVRTGMVSNMKATEISREVGGAFSFVWRVPHRAARGAGAR